MILLALVLLTQQSVERHVAIGTVIAHVLPDGTAYATDGEVVLPLLAADVRITARRAEIRLSTTTRTCVLPPAALDEQRGILWARTGTTLRTTERFRVQTWVTDACVVWRAVTHRTLTTTEEP